MISESTWRPSELVCPDFYVDEWEKLHDDAKYTPANGEFRVGR